MKDKTVSTEYHKTRLLAAFFAAAAVTVAALLVPPLGLMDLSAGKRTAALAVPFSSVFALFALARRPERRVFRSACVMYLACVPAVQVLLGGVVFAPSRAEQYAASFFGRFLPAWAALWWLGAAAALGLMRLAARAAKKDCRFSRTACALAVMFTPQKTLSREKRPGRRSIAAAAVLSLPAALGVFLGVVAVYLNTVYSNMEFEAILFTMRFAAGGLAAEDIIAGTAIFLIFAAVSGYVCFFMIRCLVSRSLTVADSDSDGCTVVMNGRKRAVCVLLSAVLLVGGAAMISGQTRFFHYVRMKLGRSTIYENCYVVPDSSIVTFPEKKRNLVFIYLESMENTYASRELGGSQDRNYIEPLTDLAAQEDCVSFSNTELLGGASVFVPSLTFTQGSTVAQTSGISLNTQLFPETPEPEFPDAIRLEDILRDNGYAQLYIEGSKGEFSMYDKYVGRYDDCTLFDRVTAAEQGYTDEDGDYIWKWGIEDRKLFDITKQLVTDMAQGGRPFFVTMYTMDTHTFECGHRCPNCDSSIKSDYLASVECSSRLTAAFIGWLREQPFFENTTVILVGDHLGNEKTTLVDIGDGYTRTTYNCFINPAKQPAETKHRLFSSVDMFPTTLSAIGAEIRGDRLGLGTDLFSETPTLCEELGEEEYKLQLERTSDYYSREFYAMHDS